MTAYDALKLIRDSLESQAEATEKIEATGLLSEQFAASARYYRSLARVAQSGMQSLEPMEGA